MLLRRRTISLLLILSATWLSGCGRTHAKSAPSQPTPAIAQAPAPPAAKHPPRDSAFSVYNNPAYGVSFRYPRNYSLDEEPDSEDPSILQAQQELAAQQPGSLLIATVTIPPDAYPNTTFRSGTLRLVINPMVTPETCQSFAIPGTPDPRDSTGASTISGIPFSWRQSGDFVNDLHDSTRVYTGFFHSACYEFYLEVTDSASIVPVPSEKPADATKIMRQLDKIVSSLQIRPPAPTASNHP